ncbi:MAG TPA: CRTAC1 family protein [Thermoanaerobaculia bacterium]|nr:CRTAC1 family protein [Thermoanaerobaculia bacterium]
MNRCRLRLAVVTALLVLPGMVGAEGVTFRNLADDPAAGLQYARTPSATAAKYDALASQSIYTMPDVVATPEKHRGAPGVALLDFDGDGDLDLYVTNGPGTANSLFANQLADGDSVRFVDVGAASGAGLADQDSTGVCFGDLDNDGDHDLVVLGRSEPNRLLENLGDGTFRDATAGSGLGEDSLGHTGCSLGDVDGDGLLDLFVGNSFDWASREPIFTVPYAASHPNQLYRNTGRLAFADVSGSSGIRNLTGFRPAADGSPTVTWAVAMVDYDQDGDIDIFQADDQAAMPSAKYGNIDRGYVHLLENDGRGNFRDVTVRAGLDKPGQWMGLSFADFNCDGILDFFGTNMGDYAFTVMPIPYERGDSSARWFLGQVGGRFEDPGLGPLVSDPFGWSVTTPDYDNDGDPDVLYFGSLHNALHVSTAENPGAVLQNQGCSAVFQRDTELLPTNHARRNVQGGASGDLDRDGVADVVTAASVLYDEPAPLTRYAAQYGGPFDDAAVYVEQFRTVGEMQFVYNENVLSNGDLAVEISDQITGNGSVTVRTLGAVGLVDGARANRDGIGAVVTFQRRGGPVQVRPVVGGSSHLSQDSLELIFGTGTSDQGHLDVLWPGGTRNRLYGVRAGERVTVPEIPCSYDGAWDGFESYKRCVDRAVVQLRNRGVIDDELAPRLRRSAYLAFEHNSPGE